MKDKKPKPDSPPIQVPRRLTALWVDLPLETRIKEANAPLYLKRYE